MTTQNNLKSELDEHARNDTKLAAVVQKNSHDGYWFWNLEKPAEAWMSPEFWELFGYEASDMKGLASEWRALCFSDELETPQVSLKAHCTGDDASFDQVMRYRHKEGHAVWVRCRGVIVRDEAGQPVRMLVGHTDVSSMMQVEETRGRLQAQASLRRAKQDIQNLEAYKAVLNASPIGTCLWRICDHSDPGAMVLALVSDGASQVSATDIRQFVGQTMQEAFPELLKTDLPQSYIDVLRSGEATTQEIEYGDSNISKKWFHVRLFKVSETLVAISYDDISERKLAERKLAAMRRRLERSNSELEQFAYVASHDLQEPLRMVAMFTQLLARQYEDKLDAQAKEYIKYASDGAMRMKSLIESLLEVSRITSRKEVLIPVDLDALVSHLLEGMRHSKTLDGVTVNRDVLPSILGDASQLRRVFQNLIGNAVKFNRSEDPTVTIGAQTLGDKVQITVADNGVGIPEHQHKRIFEMFKRLHKRSEFGGTGMGLAIVQRIVERHNGLISVESADGQGTTFRLTFPSA